MHCEIVGWNAAASMDALASYFAVVRAEQFACVEFVRFSVLECWMR